MNKLVRNIIILVAVLAALVGGIWWVMAYEPKQEEDEAPSQSTQYETVYKVSEEDISAIVINNSGNTLKFTKKGDDWLLDGYDKSKISQTKVQSLVTSVSSITSKNPVSDAKADCGLENTSLTINVTLTDGKTDVIKIGDKSPVLGEYFCCVNDGDVYMVSSYKVDDYLKTAAHYTSFSRVSFTASDITEVKIERKGGNTLHIRQKNDADSFNAWEIISPYMNAYNAIDQFIQDKILTSIEGIQITTPAEASSDTGLASPRAVITVVSEPVNEQGERGAAETEVIKVGNSSGSVTYVEYDGEVYEISSANISFADTDEFLVVSKLLALVPIQGLTKMSITSPSASYDFEVNHSNIDADDDEMTFKINGAAAAEKKSKSIYQEVIGLSADGVYKHEVIGDTVCEIVFETTSGTRTVTFSAINELSAAFTVDGLTEFTVKRSAVDAMLTKLAEFAANPM